MAERLLPGVSMEQLGEAQRAVIRETEKLTSAGTPVRYLGTTFVPAESRCMCFFEAEGVDAVRAANEQAQIPFTQIVEAMELLA
jgi:hypothetical protein